MTATAPEALEAGRANDDDELFHLICCDDDVALCGKDVSQSEFAQLTTQDMLCIVCELTTLCTLCGLRYDRG